jgi:hypothetical protein
VGLLVGGPVGAFVGVKAAGAVGIGGSILGTYTGVRLTWLIEGLPSVYNIVGLAATLGSVVGPI